MIHSPEWTAPRGVPKSDHTPSFHGKTAKQQSPNSCFVAVFSVHIRVNWNLPDVAAAACRTVFCDAIEFVENRNPLYLHKVCSFDELSETFKRCFSIVPIPDILSFLGFAYNTFRYFIEFARCVPETISTRNIGW